MPYYGKFCEWCCHQIFFQAKINNKTYVLKQISVKKNKNKFKKLYINYIKVIQYIKKIKIKV